MQVKLNMDENNRSEVGRRFNMLDAGLHQQFLDLGYEELEPVQTGRSSILEDLKNAITDYETRRGVHLDKPITIPAEFVRGSRAADLADIVQHKVIYAVYSLKSQEGD